MHKPRDDWIVRGRGSWRDLLGCEDNRRDVRPRGDRHIAVCCQRNPVRGGKAWLAFPPQKPVKVGPGNAKDFGPFAIRSARAVCDVLFELVHAVNVTHCDKPVKGVI